MLGNRSLLRRKTGFYDSLVVFLPAELIALTEPLKDLPPETINLKKEIQRLETGASRPVGVLLRCTKGERGQQAATQPGQRLSPRSQVLGKAAQRLLST